MKAGADRAADEPPVEETSEGELEIRYACGLHRADREEYSTFRPLGESCDLPFGEMNTFALELSGSAAGSYSAVVRCGFVRYDNGDFVGDRVEVEARDGEWCHEVALEQITLVDRMLLTDVSFAIEPVGAATAQHPLDVSMQSRDGWSKPFPADASLCVYVAYRQIGASACGMVPPAPFCTCPPDAAWQDFFEGIKLTAGKRH